MSKGFRKKILPFAAMFIPVVGPAIGTAIGLSGTVAAVAGSAIAGGTLNAAAGGNVIKGAVSGGLSGFAAAGGFSGLKAGATAGTTAGDAVTTAGTTASAGLGSKIKATITSLGGKISEGLQDPDMWGRAAQYLAAGGISAATAKKNPELAKYMAELERLSKDNSQIQRAAFGVGNELVAQARGINPVAEGMVAANEAQLRVLGAGREAVRNMPASREAMRAVTEAQFKTNAARAGASAYNTGFRGGRADQRAGLQGAYTGVPILQAQGAGAAQLGLQRDRDEGTRTEGILGGLKYITTGQEPQGQKPAEEKPEGSSIFSSIGNAFSGLFSQPKQEGAP